MSALSVLRGGLLTSVQDLGRPGFQRYGVSVGGAMDLLSLRVANLLVGNSEGEAALEVTLDGPTLRFEGEALIALCGGDLSPALEGAPVPTWRPVRVRSGGVLRFGEARSGCRIYVAVAGGFDLPPVMGSRSTDLRAGFGGFQGRSLREGDRLPLRVAAPRIPPRMSRLAETDRPFTAPDWLAALRPVYAPQLEACVVRGGEFDRFRRESRTRFFHDPFLVTPRSDRMGYRLLGPKLELSAPCEMISEAVAAGTVQVSPDGDPIVLMADRPPTGGYPKIAHVISVDLPILAQARPGEEVRFREVTLAEARDGYRRREIGLRLLKEGIAARGG